MTDVVIVGGGPGGLALGCYLAERGLRPWIIEKANHPRPHVGESLMPIALRIFEEIGFLPTLEAAGFTRSRGIVYHPAAGRPIELAYGELATASGPAADHTYHVDRAKMDLLLLKHAEGLGCKVLQGVPVTKIRLDEEGRADGVVVSVGTSEVAVPARLVVDASGRATKIGRQLGLRRDDPELSQFALHAWFRNVDRGAARRRTHTHVFLVPAIGGWTWQSPIDDEVTSIGVVAHRDAFHRSGLEPHAFFLQALGTSAPLAKAMRNAERINDLKGEVNYRYHLERICGDGWIAVGDAARFMDPMFSSGVGHALTMARSASEHVVAALEGGDIRREDLLPYERDVFDRARIWEEFVETFYRQPAAFTHFAKATEHRVAALRLLQGQVDERAGPGILDAMREFVGRGRPTDG